MKCCERGDYIGEKVDRRLEKEVGKYIKKGDCSKITEYVAWWASAVCG
jgi:hypothetical protein